MSTDTWTALAAWAAFAISIIGGLVAWKRYGDTRDQAHEAREIALQSVEAMDRIAESIGQLRAPASRVEDLSDAPTEATPSLDGAPWFVQYQSANLYLLRNVSIENLTNVHLAEGTPHVVQLRNSSHVDLGPLESTQLLITKSMGAVMPGEIRVICDERPDGDVVPLP